MNNVEVELLMIMSNMMGNGTYLRNHFLISLSHFYKLLRSNNTSTH